MPNAIRRRIRIALLCSSLAVAIVTRRLAFAQSGSAGGSIGNDEKSLSGSRQAPRSVETEKPGAAEQARSPRSRAVAVAEERRRWWRRQFRRRMGCQCRRRYLSGSSSKPSSSAAARLSVKPPGVPSVRMAPVRDLRRQRPDDHHHRPFLWPQRLRNVPPIGRLYRNVDGIETVARFQPLETQCSCKTPFDAGSASPFSAARSQSSLPPALRSRSPAAPAAASATTKNRCRVRGKRHARSRPERPARRSRPEAEEPRRSSSRK